VGGAAPPARPTIDELVLTDEPEAWRDCGFRVEGGLCEVGSGRLRLEPGAPGRGIVGWSLRGLAGGELDGLPTTSSERLPARGDEHPNGAISIDHVVAFTPDLERTTDALRSAGLDFRRLREGPTPGGARRQSFFRLGEAVLEVIEAPPGSRIREERDGPARLWGIAFLVRDLERPASVLGERLGRARDAVQPGRRIAPLRKEAGLGPAVAFITPGPGAA
jgi:catechol 2,3-dioxygenase-like lactoylglutathione lyase family enzyme